MEPPLPAARRITIGFWALAVIALALVVASFLWRGLDHGWTVSIGGLLLLLAGRIYLDLRRRSIDSALAGTIHASGRLSAELPNTLRYLEGVPTVQSLGAVWLSNDELIARSFNFGSREIVRIPVDAVTSVSYESRAALVCDERVIVIRTIDSTVSIAPVQSRVFGGPVTNEEFLTTYTALRRGLLRQV
jgi:hypothetical protein